MKRGPSSPFRASQIVLTMPGARAASARRRQVAHATASLSTRVKPERRPPGDCAGPTGRFAPMADEGPESCAERSSPRTDPGVGLDGRARVRQSGRRKLDREGGGQLNL